MATVSATLTYTVRPFGKTAAQIVTLIHSAAIPIPAEYLAFIGGTIGSDTTVVAGGNAVRTIVWTFNAQFKQNWPDTSDQKAPFNGLFEGLIASKSGCQVITSPVVIT